MDLRTTPARRWRGLADLSIARRLMWGFGLLLCLWGSLAALAVHELSQLSRHSDRLVSERFARVVRANWLIDLANETARTIGGTLLADDPRNAGPDWRRVAELRTQVTQQLAWFGAQRHAPAERQRLEVIARRRTAYWGAQARFFELYRSGDRRAARAYYLDEVLGLQRRYVQALDALIRYESRQVELEADAVQAQYRRMLSLFILGAIVALVIAIVIGVGVTRSITRPLRGAVQIAHQVAAGQLDVDVGPKSSNETGQLMHALQVMAGRLAQDRDRRQASEQALRDNEARYRFLAENSSDVICRHDAHCRYTYVSPSSLAVLGRAPEALLGQTPEVLLHPDDRARVREIHRAGEHVAGDTYTFTFRSGHTDDRPRWIEVVSHRIADAADRNAVAEVVSVMRDVTVRHEAEQHLRRSRELLARSQQQARLGSWWFDFSTGAAQWAGESERILGFGPGAALSLRQLLRIVHPGDRARVRAAWRALRAGAACDIEHRIRVDGGERWLRQRAELQRDAAGRAVEVLGTLQDITPMKAKEEELLRSRQLLRDLAAHRERLRERERLHIAREIHDELGQQLTALRLDAAMISMQYGHHDPGIPATVDGMKQTIDGTMKVVRHVVATLRPGALDAGLVPAAEWLLADFTRRSGVAARFEDRPVDIELDAVIATAAFRILQEALTNVARHAYATEVAVRIACSADAVCVQVRDNGVGLSPDREHAPDSFGLLGMRERALMFGGRIELASCAGEGTTLTAWLPLTRTRIE